MAGGDEMARIPEPRVNENGEIEITGGIKGQLVRDDRGSEPKIYVIEAITASYVATLRQLHGQEDLEKVIAEFSYQAPPDIAYFLR